MGLPAEPASRDTERRGMSFSKTEAASFDRYFRILDQNRAIQRELENHPNILNFYVEPSISTPMFTFTVDSGARGAVDVLLKTKLVDVDYRVIEAPVDRLTRDKFWQTLRFEFIHIRKKSNYRTPIVDAMRKAGLDPVDASLGGSDWRVEIKLRKVTPETTPLLHSISGLVANGFDLFRVIEGKPRKDKQAAAPARGSVADMARGGKEIANPQDDEAFCTSGPVVTDGSQPPYLLTAGHCVTLADTKATVDPALSVLRVGNQYASVLLACDECVAAGQPFWPLNNPPTWWWGIGVDVAAMFYGAPNPPTQNGFGPSRFVSFFGSTFYDQQLGSADPYNGQQMVCVEGASAFKRPPNYATNVQGAYCGTADGVSSDDFRQIALWAGGVACGGDSGAITTLPGFGSGSWVTGVLSASDEMEIWNNNPQCDLSTGGPDSRVYISSFWKIHHYLLNYHGTTAWVLTY
jgi:hypothetical protein